MKTKQCKGCQVVKPLTEYYQHPNSPDKREYTCQDCKRAYVMKQYQQRQARRAALHPQA